MVATTNSWKPLAFPNLRVQAALEKVEKWAEKAGISKVQAQKIAQATIEFLDEGAERGFACPSCGVFCGEKKKVTCKTHGRVPNAIQPLFIKFEPVKSGR
ncbi:MAG: hypothetical protein Q8P13_02330 [bacterium]|nr:hypothetical protein [bacterium]